jgi:putative endonuclease
MSGFPYLYSQAMSRSPDDEARMTTVAYLYILRCADGRYYVGTTRKSLEERLGEHNAGLHGGFTAARRPVAMVFAQHFETITDAIAAERQVKGWSRAKKEAMIKGEWNRLPELAKRRNSTSGDRAF